MMDERRRGRIEGVVHEDVDPAIGGDHLVHRRLDLIGIADVADNAERGAAGGLDVGNDSVHIGGRERKNGHLRAFRCEQLGRGAADAATGACDDRDLSVESTHVHLHSVGVGEFAAGAARLTGA